MCVCVCVCGSGATHWRRELVYMSTIAHVTGPYRSTALAILSVSHGVPIQGDDNFQPDSTHWLALLCYAAMLNEVEDGNIRFRENAFFRIRKLELPPRAEKPAP